MICRIYDVPGATLDQYDAVDRQVGPETPDGAYLHIAGTTEDGFRVIEVWESEEDAKRFVERLRPAFEAVGALAPPPPELWPVHNYMA